jgi:hypothetical protein
MCVSILLRHPRRVDDHFEPAVEELVHGRPRARIAPFVDLSQQARPRLLGLADCVRSTLDGLGQVLRRSSPSFGVHRAGRMSKSGKSRPSTDGQAEVPSPLGMVRRGLRYGAWRPLQFRLCERRLTALNASIAVSSLSGNVCKYSCVARS